MRTIDRIEQPAAQTVTQQPVERPHPVRRVARTLTGLMLLVTVAGATAVSLVPAVTGASALTVLSGSMTPALPVGSIIVVRSQPADQIKAGDVITFTDRSPDLPAPRVVTHRVVAVEQGPGGLAFRTQGDANNAPDQRPAAAADVHGVLWYSVPLAGSLRTFLISPAGLCYLVGVALLMVAGHLLTPGVPTGRHRRLRTRGVANS
ncbi:MAG: signal peptidase I [Pseudonocardiaceae bacterium]